MMGAEQLGRLLAEHAAALALYARQWCDAPEDVVQEALVRLLVQKKPPLEPAAWLYRVVRNLAISARRSLARRRRHEAIAAQRATPWFEPAQDSALDVAAVTGALESLPGEQREVVTLHLWGGLTFAQIAGVIGTSSSTAHRWYLDALDRLRERLKLSCTSQAPTKP